jgi:hypothetical protein
LANDVISFPCPDLPRLYLKESGSYVILVFYVALCNTLQPTTVYQSHLYSAHLLEHDLSCIRCQLRALLTSELGQSDPEPRTDLLVKICWRIVQGHTRVDYTIMEGIAYKMKTHLRVPPRKASPSASLPPFFVSTIHLVWLITLLQNSACRSAVQLLRLSGGSCSAPSMNQGSKLTA